MQMVLATFVLHEEAILQVAYKINIKQPAYFFFVVVVFLFPDHSVVHQRKREDLTGRNSQR